MKGQLIGQKELRTTPRHDPYRERAKHPEGMRCEKCTAVFSAGRWTWDEAVETTATTVCPACRRMADHVPAGVVMLRGDFFAGHRQEILGLIRNVQEREGAEHPMERIMAIEDADEGTIIQTTGVHVASRIGKALESAYDGRLSEAFGESDYAVRVSWER